MVDAQLLVDLCVNHNYTFEVIFLKLAILIVQMCKSIEIDVFFTGSQLLHYSECPLVSACAPSLKGCVCMVDCLSTLACSVVVGKLSSIQALPSGRDLMKKGKHCAA